MASSESSAAGSRSGGLLFFLEDILGNGHDKSNGLDIGPRVGIKVPSGQLCTGIVSSAKVRG